MVYKASQEIKGILKTGTRYEGKTHIHAKALAIPESNVKNQGRMDYKAEIVRSGQNGIRRISGPGFRIVEENLRV